MTIKYLHRALARLEKRRQEILEERGQDRHRPALSQKLVFDPLTFEEKKAVTAQFIRRIEVGDDTAEIIWNV